MNFTWSIFHYNVIFIWESKNSVEWKSGENFIEAIYRNVSTKRNNKTNFTIGVSIAARNKLMKCKSLKIENYILKSEE